MLLRLVFMLDLIVSVNWVLVWAFVKILDGVHVDVGVELDVYWFWC